MRSRLQPSLDLDRIVAAAFEQLEEDGLEGVSMRRLATRLGVQAPALYWHVGDKAELLGLMAREMYAEAYAAVPNAQSWPEWLERFGLALRRSFAARRDGARLCATARPSSKADPDVRATQISLSLTALGLSKSDAISFIASVISFTIGWATFEANAPMYHFLDQMMDFNRSFEQGLQALIRGYERDFPKGC